MTMTLEFKPAGRLLQPTGGFLEGYTHSLNPYMGCVFGCSYCYVRQLPPGLFRGLPWGEWVTVKTNARERLARELAAARRRGPVRIFLSSSTDPYQPVEYRERITRSILEVLCDQPPDYLFLQTRSPLVVRDVDLFRKLRERLMISITVETDLEEVRQRFTPKAPPIPARIRAIRSLLDEGLAVQAAVAPLLPSSDRFPEALPPDLTRIVVDHYATGDGSGGRRTERLGVRNRYSEEEAAHFYGTDALERLLERLRLYYPEDRLFVSREGFLPPNSGGTPSSQS